MSNLSILELLLDFWKIHWRWQCCVGMIVLMATSAMVWAAETGGSGGGNAGTKITESIIYAEGVDLDGLPVEESSEFTEAIIGPAENIEIDWSDNLIYTQFPAGRVPYLPKDSKILSGKHLKMVIMIIPRKLLLNNFQSYLISPHLR